MHYLIDLNILVYALREAAPEHRAAREWLEDSLDLRERMDATTSTLVALIRLAGNPNVFAEPNAERAFRFVGALIASGMKMTEPSTGAWSVFHRLCLQHQIEGDDVPDAYLAAIAIENDATLVTHDRGFDRFPELRTFDPIAEVA